MIVCFYFAIKKVTILPKVQSHSGPGFSFHVNNPGGYLEFCSPAVAVLVILVFLEEAPRLKNGVSRKQ